MKVLSFKSLIAALAVAGILAAGSVILNQLSSTAEAAGGFSIDQEFYLTPGSGVSVQAGEVTATTSVHFLRTTDVATSSVSGFVGRGGQLALDYIFTASSTATVLTENRYYSDNGIDWYAEDLTTTSTNILVAHSSSTPAHTWTPQTTLTQKKHTVVTDVQAKYFKYEYRISGANGSLWVQATPKAENPN